MTYKILSSRPVGEIIYTEVEYNFDGEKVTVDIHHERPQSQIDIDLGIANRAVTEKKKIDEIKRISALSPTIEIGVEKPL